MQPLQQQQQQAAVQTSKLLHTPQRTAAAAGSSMQRKRWVVPQQDNSDTSSSGSTTTAFIASSREACVTPPRQGPSTAYAGGAAAGGLQSPRLSTLGSARRVVPAGATSAAAGAGGRTQLLSPRMAGEDGVGRGRLTHTCTHVLVISGPLSAVVCCMCFVPQLLLLLRSDAEHQLPFLAVLLLLASRHCSSCAAASRCHPTEAATAAHGTRSSQQLPGTSSCSSQGCGRWCPARSGGAARREHDPCPQ